MTVEELESFFEAHEDDYLKFNDIPSNRKNTARPDLQAFLLLDRLVPSKLHALGYGNDIISAAEHDEIFLEASLKDLAEVATEEQVLDLIRCGVRISDDSLAMFA
jgi:hypothetical protein